MCLYDVSHNCSLCHSVARQLPTLFVVLPKQLHQHNYKLDVSTEIPVDNFLRGDQLAVQFHLTMYLHHPCTDGLNPCIEFAVFAGVAVRFSGYRIPFFGFDFEIDRPTLCPLIVTRITTGTSPFLATRVFCT